MKRLLSTCLQAAEGGASIPFLLASLKACSSSRDLARVHEIHEAATQSGGESSIYVASSLVDCYAKCGSLEDARRVFDGMRRHTVVTWNALMFGYAENGEAEKALDLYSQMRTDGCPPAARSFVAALKACACLAENEEWQEVDGKLVRAKSLARGVSLHRDALISGFDADAYVAATLVALYAKCGSITEARMVFEKVKRSSLVAWNAMILGYAENGEEDKALELFGRMQSDGCGSMNTRTFVAALKACTNLAAKEQSKQVNGKLVKLESLERGIAVHCEAVSRGFDADLFVANTLVDMYAKCGSMERSQTAFDRIQERDVVSWNALLFGYVENREGRMALLAFARMQVEGYSPNARTLVAAVKACGMMASLKLGRSLHADIGSLGLENNVLVATSLIDFYGKCGSMASAKQVFDGMSTRNLITWNALITGYSCRGDTGEVIKLFHRIREHGLQPDGVTFLGVLSACSHAGLIDTGREYFDAMEEKYGVTPSVEHYRCMVDMLGRSNKLDEAVALVRSMPFEADAVSWTAVLGACNKWKNVSVGKLAFDSLLELGEPTSGSRALMANIYGSKGMWKEQADLEIHS